MAIESAGWPLVVKLAPAADNPVARIAVDIPLAHLDRPFDYLVPERLAAQACPGARVRVRFAGQLTDGFVLDRVSASDHQGRLAYLERVVSAEPVLTAEIAGLARAVADRYAGTLADVLRLAVPQRHAATESAPRAGRLDTPGRPEPGPWDRYPAGRAFLDAIADSRPARAAWTAMPGGIPAPRRPPAAAPPTVASPRLRTRDQMMASNTSVATPMIIFLRMERGGSGPIRFEEARRSGFTISS